MQIRMNDSQRWSLTQAEIIETKEMSIADHKRMK